MKHAFRIFCILLFCSVLQAALLHAADCSSLKSLHLEDTTITRAESVTSGSLQIPGAAPITGLPAICRIAGVLHPSSDSTIRFELWLPEHGWNGRFLGVGNGGFAGTIGYHELSPT